MASGEVESREDLSEGEVVDDEEEDPKEEDVVKPKSKRRRLSAGGDSEGWEKLSKRQQRKMAKRKHREKKKHPEREDKYAAGLSPNKKTRMLNTLQTELLQQVVDLIEGRETKHHVAQAPLKTAMFQELISSLVIGSPMPLFFIPGYENVREDHRFVVVWLSMVSSTFFNASDAHFPRLKKLNPSVRFELQHPGTHKFVKLGLEAFMMSTASNNDSNSQNSSSSDGQDSADASKSVLPRASYLFSLKKLTDNEFPNPSQGDVDQLGRCVGDYVSIRQWPDCEIEDMPEVKAGLSGGDEDDDEDVNDGTRMPLFAIDCEMVETTESNSELVRVSIVNEELECIYDTLVKPDCPVVDYRTKYSGITASTLEDVTTTLKDVQEKLPEILPANSILVGHSLENDFHAMKFRHPFVIDTSLLFTPFATPSYKPGLRKLSKELLIADIQSSDKGHDSIEDATTCMKLVLLKLKSGASCKISFNDFTPTPTLLTDLRVGGCTTSIIDKESVVRLFGKGSSNPVDVKTDKDAVEKCKDVISASKFTFVQLHGMEYALKLDPSLTSENQLEASENLDKMLVELVEGCPSKTVLFVVLGSGDIRKVRSLQQQEFADFGRLKKEVMCARTGKVITVLVD